MLGIVEGDRQVAISWPCEQMASELTQLIITLLVSSVLAPSTAKSMHAGYGLEAQELSL